MSLFVEADDFWKMALMSRNQKRTKKSSNLYVTLNDTWNGETKNAVRFRHYLHCSWLIHKRRNVFIFIKFIGKDVKF